MCRCSGLLIKLLARFKHAGNTPLRLHGRLVSTDRLPNTDITAHLFQQTHMRTHVCETPGTQIPDTPVLVQLYSITTFLPSTNYSENANGPWELCSPKERSVPARQKLHQRQMSRIQLGAPGQRKLEVCSDWWNKHAVLCYLKNSLGQTGAFTDCWQLMHLSGRKCLGATFAQVVHTQNS